MFIMGNGYRRSTVYMFIHIQSGKACDGHTKLNNHGTSYREAKPHTCKSSLESQAIDNGRNQQLKK